MHKTAEFKWLDYADYLLQNSRETGLTHRKICA